MRRKCSLVPAKEAGIEVSAAFCGTYFTHVFSCFSSYGDAVRELDYGVGKIIDTLKKLQIDKNTLVVFSSDNGAATYAKNRGVKMLGIFFE